MTYIYEQEQLNHFENQILSGQITRAHLEQMLNENRLTEGQLRVIEELSPMLGGLGNAARKAATGIGNAFKQARTQGLDKMKGAYNQGKEQTVANNATRALGQQWQIIDKTVKNSKLFEQMKKFQQMFPGSDEYVNQALAYIQTTFLDLEHYLANKHPELKIQTDASYVPEWEKQRQKQQQSIDAQTDMAGTQQRQRYRQDVAKNPGKPRKSPSARYGL